MLSIDMWITLLARFVGSVPRYNPMFRFLPQVLCNLRGNLGINWVSVLPTISFWVVIYKDFSILKDAVILK